MYNINTLSLSTLYLGLELSRSLDVNLVLLHPDRTDTPPRALGNNHNYAPSDMDNFLLHIQLNIILQFYKNLLTPPDYSDYRVKGIS